MQVVPQKTEKYFQFFLLYQCLLLVICADKIHWYTFKSMFIIK